MDSPKHCRVGNRAGSLFDSGHNYPGGIKNLYYYNERAEHIFVFCLYRAGAEGEYVAAATRRRRRILQAGFFFTL